MDRPDLSPEDPTWAPFARFVAQEVARQLRLANRSAALAAEYLTTRDAAAYLGLTERGLRVRVSRGQGPKRHRIGKLVRYRRVDLDAYAKSSGDGD